MSERLTVALEDGTLDKLRTLAGGERKVGAYLSQLVAWLWEHKEDIDAVGVAGCVILRRDKIGYLLGADAETLQQTLQRLKAEAEATKARIEAIRTGVLQEAQELRSELARLSAEAVELRKLLPTQEDSSRNDA